MEERLTKIAEASFRKAMAKFSSWGDIGIALKNVQSEIREVSKRTRTVEYVLGHPWNYGQNAKQSADKTSSEIRHLSGEQVKQIRLKKKLKISHMAQLLNVSIRKYTIFWQKITRTMFITQLGYCFCRSELKDSFLIISGTPEWNWGAPIIRIFFARGSPDQ